MKKPKQFKPNKANTKGSFSLESNKKDTGRSKGYNAVWEKYRYKFLYYNPRCYACGRDKKDCRMHVDHIRAHKGNMDLFWDEKNYITLCHSCHSIVTGRFDKFSEPKTMAKVEWLIKQREMFGIKVAVKVVPFGRLNREIKKQKDAVA